MFLPLHQRGFDTIEEFRAAAMGRYEDARRLHRRSRDLGAIYLFGYAVEMLVKAAYFHNAGFLRARTISKADRKAAAQIWSTLGLLAEPGQHDIAGWASLAVAARVTCAIEYPLGFGNEIVTRASSLYLIWRETLRYRATQPLGREVREIRSIADWFMLNGDRMF